MLCGTCSLGAHACIIFKFPVPFSLISFWFPLPVFYPLDYGDAKQLFACGIELVQPRLFPYYSFYGHNIFQYFAYAVGLEIVFWQFHCNPALNKVCFCTRIGLYLSSLGISLFTMILFFLSEIRSDYERPLVQTIEHSNSPKQNVNRIIWHCKGYHYAI